MKYNIKHSTRFKKSYKLAQKRGLDVFLLKEVIVKLGNGIPLEAKHKDHALKGRWKGFRECHIEPDGLLVYELTYKYIFSFKCKTIFFNVFFANSFCFK
ncbi:MAG: type II toxin-antitoxin system YafQ family toxin [Lachnospiraceae bacterium]|nr:type II toxin-antitoxin system YafQ family toxin [Lachnospiraceae bacterium]